MARKTAMKKEPSKVSVAIPQSEKNRLAKPGNFQPGPAGMAERLAGGVTQPPLKRLSPGVYRNAQGQLVGNKGQALPGQRPQPRQQPGRSIVNAISQQPPQQQQPQQPPMAPPENAAALAGQVAQDLNDPAFNGGMYTTDMGMTREGRPAEGQQWGNKPYVGDMPQMPRPFMGPKPIGNFSPDQRNQLYQQFQQQNQPGSVSGMLQQGGQPQQQMPFPQMVSPMPQITPEQFQQMQMGAPQPMAQANQRFVPYKG